METIKLDFIATVTVLIMILGINGFFRRYHIDINGFKKGNLHTKIIYDLGHTYLPKIMFKDKFNQEIFGYVRHFVAGFPALMALTFLEWEQKVSFLADLGILYIIRMIANNLTVLPSIRKCNIKEKNPFHVGGCCDLMFSGHTLTCLIATLYYLYYVSDKYTTLLLLFNFINQFLILANRRHYSDDVFLAWFVTLTVFFIRTNEPNKVIKGLFSAVKNIFPHK